MTSAGAERASPALSRPQPRLCTSQQLPLLALAARQLAPLSTWPLRCTRHPSYAGNT